MMAAKILAAAAAFVAALVCTLLGYIEENMGADPWDED